MAWSQGGTFLSRSGDEKEKTTAQVWFAEVREADFSAALLTVRL